MTIAGALEFYWNDRGEKLPSAKTIKIHGGIWCEYWGAKSLEDITAATEERFHAWLLGHKQCSVGYARRIINTGRAAINHCWKKKYIKRQIPISQIESKAHLEAPPKGKPFENAAHIGKLFHAIRNIDHLYTACLLLLATGARPNAILGLTWGQIDFRAGLIDLQPPGKPRTSKRNPVVRIPQVLLGHLLYLQEEGAEGKYVVTGTDRNYRGVSTAWRNAIRRAGLDKEYKLYSFRHTIARWLRVCGVDSWAVSAQMGHSTIGLNITERYAPHDPAYLADAAEAINKLMMEVMRMSMVPVETLHNDDDVAEFWHLSKKQKSEKRAQNREDSPKLLQAAGIEFETRNLGAHLIVRGPGNSFTDFWPGTGKWFIRGERRSGRGVKNLIALFGEKS